MLKIILQNPNYINPFNERARDLRIMNRPLWLSQRDTLAPYVTRELELPFGMDLPDVKEECLVYRDNLYFDSSFVETFLKAAKSRKGASRLAFSVEDAAFREHALPLSISYVPDGNIYLADFWYYPHGTQEEATPLVIDLKTSEAGYYHVPTYMAYEQGDLIFHVPEISVMAIDCWTHIFIADIVFGLFGRAVRTQKRLDNELAFKLRVLGTALYEGRQLLTSSPLVKVGRNCTIHPGAMIYGPTTIGDNVHIDAGAVIENCIIGDNVNVGQGCQLMLSVVGDGTFLPFRAALFMTTFMDYSMVAQNTCLQMCVVGRSTFVGAGSTFTDYNLLPAPLRAIDGNGKLGIANRPVLGSCVGHNCRLGAGMIIFPARTIESDVVLFASPERRVIEKDVRYEDSDHHKLKFKNLHPRLYPRPGEQVEESW
jgi:acetyltransferase-like isoleucine patch superfamily enzyme